MKDDLMIVFTPSGRRGRVPSGTTVLQAARDLGVDLDSVCGGRAICGRCQVTLSEGSFPKHGIESRSENLSDFGANEISFDQAEGLKKGRRLGCSARLLGDAVIDVPPESQVHRQVVRKRTEVHDLAVNPLVRLYVVEVSEPSMHEPVSDLHRLFEELEFEWGLTDLTCDGHVLKVLQPIMRKGSWQVTVAIYQDKEIIAIWPGLHQRLLGLAVDIGSTTIAAHLVDLASGEALASAGRMNPQIRFGEDLMSRVSYVMMQPGSEDEMCAAVREAVAGLVDEVCEEANELANDILDCAFVGNPIMHHLFLGISPLELGGAPFALATDGAVTMTAKEVGLELNPGARCYVLPCIAGHVGADCAAVVLSEAPYLREEMSLLVDVGTNAEIVLGNRDRLLSASSPTGPAFEGAQISSGQRAAPGAIERVRIDPETLEPRFKVIGCDLWSDDPSFENQLGAGAITGICGSGIIEVLGEMYLSGVINTDGVIDGELINRSDRIVEDGRTFSYVLHAGTVTITITQNDVRAIQLAKAALYAGVRLLMDKLNVDKIDRIRLAGAFGSHIDVKYAMVLGLIPDCAIENVTSAGNAAGSGAHIALVDSNARLEIEREVRRIEKIETAVESRFQEHFIEAMAIPHKTASYPELSKVVSWPARSESKESAPSTGRRRRRR
ncbi:ASKHA domain-containing protein [Gammaproteobacteria bacterium]|nr:ASKHA domain-containing protein [Gammaproteobacteria bacterium]